MSKNKIIMILATIILILLVVIVVDISKIGNSKNVKESTLYSSNSTEIESNPTINQDYTQSTEKLPESKFDLSKFSEPDQFAIKDIVAYRAKELGYSDVDEVIILNVEIKGSNIIISFKINDIVYEEIRTYPKFNPIN